MNTGGPFRELLSRFRKREVLPTVVQQFLFELVVSTACKSTAIFYQ